MRSWCRAPTRSDATAVFSRNRNVTGDEVENTGEIRRTLSGPGHRHQSVGSIDWSGLAALGCDFFVELGPGGCWQAYCGAPLKGVDVTSIADVESVRIAAERLL